MSYLTLTYTRHPARYAKSMIAIQTPSEDRFKSRACSVLESVGGKSLRWSGRERSYIVSKRVADRFEAKIAELRAADLAAAAAGVEVTSYV